MTPDYIFNEFMGKLTQEEKEKIEDYKSLSDSGPSMMHESIGVWFKDGSKVIYFPKPKGATI